MAAQKVLLLGSGFVARPTLDILSEAGIEVSVACRTLQSATRLSEGVKFARPISLDVTDGSALDAEVQKHDLVVSLIPYAFHTAVIKSAIRQKKHVVTTSYVSAAMMELDQQCKNAGITVMNEIGLDPGIDNLYAIKIIEEVHKAGGKITSFMSYCGGLPSPEDSGNPLGYKFSWSSRGVLLALRNPASYYQGGAVVNVAGPDLMAQARQYHIYPYPGAQHSTPARQAFSKIKVNTTGLKGFAFVAYPNRDSTPYKERYNIPEAKTIIRGNLRYAGFPEFVKVLIDMGFLSDEEQSFLREKITWAEATQKIIGAASSNEKDLVSAVLSKVTFKDSEEKERLLAGLKWVGIFSSGTITLKMAPHSSFVGSEHYFNSSLLPQRITANAAGIGSPFDTLCATLEKKMQFEEGERDLVMLQHKFEIEHKDGKTETRTSTLCEYGAPVGSNGYSAMAKLVGVTCGVAVKQVLNGTISERGILAPLNSKINDPLMKELKEKYGIFCVEKIIA